MKKFKNSDLNSKTFNKGNKVLFFDADGCCPCIPALKHLEDIEKSFEEIDFYIYNIKDPTELDKDKVVSFFQAMPFPTTIYIKNGKIMYRLIGDNEKSRYRKYAN